MKRLIGEILSFYIADLGFVDRLLKRIVREQAQMIECLEIQREFDSTNAGTVDVFGPYRELRIRHEKNKIANPSIKGDDLYIGLEGSCAGFSREAPTPPSN